MTTLTANEKAVVLVLFAPKHKFTADNANRGQVGNFFELFPDRSGQNCFRFLEIAVFTVVLVL